MDAAFLRCAATASSITMHITNSPAEPYTHHGRFSSMLLISYVGSGVGSMIGSYMSSEPSSNGDAYIE